MDGSRKNLLLASLASFRLLLKMFDTLGCSLTDRLQSLLHYFDELLLAYIPWRHRLVGKNIKLPEKYKRCGLEETNVRKGHCFLLIHSVQLLHESLRKLTPVESRVVVVQHMVSVLEGLRVIETIDTVVRTSKVAWFPALYELVLTEITISKHKLSEEKRHNNSPGGNDRIVPERMVHVRKINTLIHDTLQS